MAKPILENNKLKQLISRLNGHLNLTGEDIADVIWLGLEQQKYSAKTPGEVITNNEDEQPPKPKVPISPPSSTNNEDQKDNGDKQPPKPKVPISPPSSTNNFDYKIKGKTLPIRHTDPRSLREPLEFVKALRPLMRRVDSGRQTILDEIETVKLIAEQSTGEQRICIPVLKSEPEPWLDLALVIDDNSSMIIWRKLIEELKEILEHYGIFREVRTWGLTKDNDKIIIKAKVGKQQTKKVQTKNFRELIDPTGRCLILIVSDCVGSMWFDGTILSALEHWTKHQPLAILQMLPNTLWLRSGLRVGAAVRLVNRNGGSISEVANSNLRIHELLIWKDFDLENRSKIPVLTPEPELASNWAGFLVGNYNKINGGFIFPHNSDFIRPPELPQTQISNLNAEQRIERFRRISSPLGRKLAGLLMAAPLISLPVIRLVQEILLRESGSVHTAEVLLGGILKPLTEITTDINPDGVIFDEVVPGIRNILLEDAPFSDSQFIFHTISDYIEKQIGKSLKECIALLNQPSPEDDGEQENLAKAYAAISLKVLRALGGEYAELAKRLQQLDVQFLEFSFEVATITITDLQPFEFEVATIEPKQTGGLFGSGQKTELIVKRRRQQSQYFIENLGNRVQLEMVQIPEGSFEMGAPQTEKDSSDTERPQHQVNVPTFFMGKYPVTQAQWKAVAALPLVNRELTPDPSRFKGANCPVERVSWYDAVEFCDRLSQSTSRTYSLPSEAEWEYACRAGTNMPFHFGETITTDLANYDGNQTYGQGSKGKYPEKTTEVGSFQVANNFGLYDMHGNVWEWCLDDWHNDYRGAPTDGSAWFNSDDKLSDKSGRAVLRGGSWIYDPLYCRSASRYYDVRAERDGLYYTFGFRVVCAVGRILQ
ncbi:formylglycine-generating enzyme family protein [Cuspidothrix issatschenkoi LEGE 03284]|uniref:formylglycine-generating enzyme family protein n=1 Tax=Cuspidothrix issatschenkoi TaxID=230752 RepID=UPI00187FCAC0|nr:formylglycine-generating enzyme family protein [Cuspidothrix issatschenkoi]MBE9231687.1 formylglycine-generating enzyme family protein [Cuspidothrix issatschenkoi LEGE 03284]